MGKVQQAAQQSLYATAARILRAHGVL